MRNQTISDMPIFEISSIQVQAIYRPIQVTEQQMRKNS